MKKNVVIILLSIVILGLGGYLVYDKVMDKEESSNETENRDEINNVENGDNLVKDFVNGKVIQTCKNLTGDNIELYEGEVPYVEATIPYVNIDTVEADKLNKKIQDSYNEEINIIKNNVQEQTTNKGPYYKLINYNYVVRNKVLFIFVETNYVAYRASGAITRNAYYYDIENDKILSAEETLEKLGKTKERVFEGMNLLFDDRKAEIQSNLDSSISIFVVGNRVIIIPTDPHTFSMFEI